MKRTLIFLLAASLFLVSPAVASASRGGGHGSTTTIKKETVVIYKTAQQRDYRYHRSDRRDYRQSRNYHRPPRHAPAHGYYKNHPSHRHQSKKVVRHHAPAPRNSVVIGVPSIIIHLGF